MCRLLFIVKHFDAPSCNYGSSKMPSQTEKETYCPSCQSVGRINRLRHFQLNFKEAMTLCEYSDCLYPMNSSPLSTTVVHRPWSLIPTISFAKTSPRPKLPRSPLKNKQHSPVKKLTKKVSPSQTKRQLNLLFNRKLSSNAEDSNSRRSISCPESNCELNFNDSCNGPAESATSAGFIQWENKDALCWLDVLLCMFVHCRSISSAYEQAVTTDLSVLKVLCKDYLLALNLSRRSSNKIQPETNESKINNHHPEPNLCGDADMTKKEKGTKALQIHESQPQVPIIDKITKLECLNNTVSLDNVACNTAVAATGAGSPCFTESKASMLDEECVKIMESARETIWRCVNTSLKCAKGVNHSPVYTAPVLINSDDLTKSLFSVDYVTNFHCDVCNYKKQKRFSEVLLTIDKNTSNLMLPCISTQKACLACGEKDQSVVTKPTRLPECLLIHFVNGLQSSDLTKLDFTNDDQPYAVSAIIEHRQDPDHFVAWIKNLESGKWMLCDDMTGPETRFDLTEVTIPPSRIHMILWEQHRNGHTIKNNFNNSTRITGYMHGKCQESTPNSVNNSKRFDSDKDVTANGEKVLRQSLRLVKLATGVRNNLRDSHVNDSELVDRHDHTTVSNINSEFSYKTLSVCLKPNKEMNQKLRSYSKNEQTSSPMMKSLPEKKRKYTRKNSSLKSKPETVKPKLAKLDNVRRSNRFAVKSVNYDSDYLYEDSVKDDAREVLNKNHEMRNKSNAPIYVNSNVGDVDITTNKSSTDSTLGLLMKLYQAKDKAKQQRWTEFTNFKVDDPKQKEIGDATEENICDSGKIGLDKVQQRLNVMTKRYSSYIPKTEQKCYDDNVCDKETPCISKSTVTQDSHSSPSKSGDDDVFKVPLRHAVKRARRKLPIDKHAPSTELSNDHVGKEENITTGNTCNDGVNATNSSNQQVLSDNDITETSNITDDNISETSDQTNAFSKSSESQSSNAQLIMPQLSSEPTISNKNVDLFLTELLQLPLEVQSTRKKRKKSPVSQKTKSQTLADDIDDSLDNINDVSLVDSETLKDLYAALDLNFIH